MQIPSQTSSSTISECRECRTLSQILRVTIPRERTLLQRCIYNGSCKTEKNCVIRTARSFWTNELNSNVQNARKLFKLFPHFLCLWVRLSIDTLYSSVARNGRGMYIRKLFGTVFRCLCICQKLGISCRNLCSFSLFRVRSRLGHGRSCRVTRRLHCEEWKGRKEKKCKKKKRKENGKSKLLECWHWVGSR